MIRTHLQGKHFWPPLWDGHGGSGGPGNFNNFHSTYTYLTNAVSSSSEDLPFSTYHLQVESGNTPVNTNISMISIINIIMISICFVSYQCLLLLPLHVALPLRPYLTLPDLPSPLQQLSLSPSSTLPLRSIINSLSLHHSTSTSRLFLKALYLTACPQQMAFDKHSPWLSSRELWWPRMTSGGLGDLRWPRVVPGDLTGSSPILPGKRETSIIPWVTAWSISSFWIIQDIIHLYSYYIELYVYHSFLLILSFFFHSGRHVMGKNLP